MCLTELRLPQGFKFKSSTDKSNVSILLMSCEVFVPAADIQQSSKLQLLSRVVRPCCWRGVGLLIQAKSQLHLVSAVTLQLLIRSEGWSFSKKYEMSFSNYAEVLKAHSCQLRCKSVSKAAVTLPEIRHLQCRSWYTGSSNSEELQLWVFQHCPGRLT